MQYVIYRPVCDPSGRYQHLEYWTGDEFEVNPRYAKRYPSKDSCRRAKSQLRKNYGALLSHEDRPGSFQALDSAYRLRYRNQQQNTLTAP